MKEIVVEGFLRTEIMKRDGYCCKMEPFEIKGMPDRFCALPYLGAFLLEVKTLDGERSEVQRAVHAKLERLGVRVFTIKGKDKIKDFLKQYDLYAARRNQGYKEEFNLQG